MKEILFETKYLNLIASKRMNKPDWVYVKRPNASNVVVILPILHREDGDYTLFLTTKRPPIVEEYGEKFCIELPAGLVGDENKDETIVDAIRKELLEETGYDTSNITILVENLVSSGGLTSEKSILAVADICNLNKKAEPVNDGGVIVDRVEVKIDKVFEFVNDMQNNGFFISAQTLAGLFLLQNL